LIRINAPLPGARYEILSMSRLRVRAALEGAIDMELLTQRMWSPYAAGIVIGLLQIPAFLLIETALGTSSSYVTVGGAVASVVDPSILDIDYVAKHVAATGKNWWQVALVAGIALGAFISMRLSGTRRRAISPIWAHALRTSSPTVRYAVAFGAGFIMLLGARIADGCTSGHGLSGVTQLGVGSVVAVAAMFAGAIATALIFLRRI
jgi:uncharacterized membrane protein YedE/YeeE